MSIQPKRIFITNAAPASNRVRGDQGEVLPFAFPPHLRLSALAGSTHSAQASLWQNGIQGTLQSARPSYIQDLLSIERQVGECHLIVVDFIHAVITFQYAIQFHAVALILPGQK